MRIWHWTRMTRYLQWPVHCNAHFFFYTIYDNWWTGRCCILCTIHFWNMVLFGNCQYISETTGLTVWGYFLYNTREKHAQALGAVEQWHCEVIWGWCLQPQRCPRSLRTLGTPLVSPLHFRALRINDSVKNKVMFLWFQKILVCLLDIENHGWNCLLLFHCKKDGMVIIYLFWQGQRYSLCIHDTILYTIKTHHFWFYADFPGNGRIWQFI